MTVLAICPSTNSPGKKDATGAFIPEARKWAKIHDGVVEQFDNTPSLARRRAQVNDILRKHKGAGHDGIGFFCHGLTKQIQTGHRLADVHGLATLLTDCTVDHGPVVALYACDAGDTQIKNGPGGDGGFADALRDALVRCNVRHWWEGHVDAHATTGHATTNPYVRRFTCAIAVPSEEVLGLVGGEWIVAPGSFHWPSWVKELKGNLRFHFPFMSENMIRRSLPI